MARGVQSNIGDKRVSPNGYEYTKTKEGWELTHRLIAEKRLGRKLREDERTRFVDGDRTNLDPENIEIREVKNTRATRINALRERIRALQQELKDLEDDADGKDE